jgi:hypothetical protein
MIGWINYEVHRVVWAFDHEGAAWVQGFAAVVSVILTAVLVWVTRRYVRLTKDMSETMRRQLLASMQPTLSISIDGLIEGEGWSDGVEHFNIASDVTISSVGSFPIKLNTLVALVAFKSSPERVWHPVRQGANIVIISGKSHRISLFLEIESAARMREIRYVGAAIDCCDLTGASMHTFYFDNQQGLRHFHGVSAERPAELEKRLQEIQPIQNAFPSA